MKLNCLPLSSWSAARPYVRQIHDPLVVSALIEIERRHGEPHLGWHALCHPLPSPSLSALCKRFSRATGMLFRQHLRAVRMRHAARLLADDTRTLADVAFDVGYSQVSNFNRDFRRWYQVTPHRFRHLQADPLLGGLPMQQINC
ncbi:MAG: helix-turn-helix transcriptional regulator [Bryobacteraceae bacterium]